MGVEAITEWHDGPRILVYWEASLLNGRRPRYTADKLNFPLVTGKDSECATYACFGPSGRVMDRHS